MSGQYGSDEDAGNGSISSPAASHYSIAVSPFLSLAAVVDRFSRGGDTAGHHLRGNVRRHDGARGWLGQANLQGARLPEAKDRVAKGGRT